LEVIMHGVDVSGDVLEIAKKGVYSLESPELVDSPIFERMTGEEMRDMFDREGDQVKIKPWIEEGIVWMLGDAGNPEICNYLTPQDMVVANNFLCHMDPPDAERCLRNIGSMVTPGGYLFVSGVDLDIRAKVASELGWKPLRDLIEEIHEGDPVLRKDWPLECWGLEPFDKRRPDWEVRYASVFRIDGNIDTD
jgi:SAM-dependent methyltransferase